ncbi:MAG: biotin/lipoyl-binding protein, partial [Pseudomonadota bacterium]
FLPDGGLRLCVFAIATTSWVTSLVVNLNPLMRFDGYYILSDTLGFGNLQNRSFEMARWRMRELLFGLGEAPPEQLSTRLRRMVIVHAWATWIYRFFLFLGIALLVYTFFIKIVGILLFVVEILWFILMPLGREMAHWWSIREQIMAAKRILVTGFVLAGLVVLSIIPWSTHITVPSLMTAQQEQRLFAPFPAQVVTMNFSEGAQVRAGDVLVELASPKLERDHALALERQALLESRIDRTSADAEDRASLIVLENELKEVREELDGLKRVRAKMVLRAPFDGTLSDLDPELHVGLWINPKTPLGMVRTAGASRIRGYVSEREVFRFKEGGQSHLHSRQSRIAAHQSPGFQRCRGIGREIARTLSGHDLWRLHRRGAGAGQRWRQQGFAAYGSGISCGLSSRQRGCHARHGRARCHPHHRQTPQFLQPCQTAGAESAGARNGRVIVLTLSCLQRWQNVAVALY